MRALDIANFIVCYANEEYSDIALTHLKLQKILYYVTTSYIKKKLCADFLYPEKIEKWQFGPVVADVYSEFKTYGGRAITAPASEIQFIEDALDFEIKEFNAKEFESKNSELAFLIKEVVNKLIDKDAFTLVEMTHQEDAWIKAEPSIKKGDRGLVYTLEELRAAKKVV